MICEPFGALVPGPGCSSMTLPSCAGSSVGTSSTTATKPARWMVACAVASSWPTTFGTATSVLAAPEPCEMLISMWSPRFAVVPGFFAWETTVPLGSVLGTYLISVIRPALWIASRAWASVFPSTSGTVTLAGCAGAFGGVVVPAGAEVVAGGDVVAGAVLFGPVETFRRTCVPPGTFSPAFGFWATTVP